MATGPDFLVYDRYGHQAAVVEVKNKRGTSREWAAKLRRNLAEHDWFRQALPRVDFFLVVTPDRIYLWRGAGDEARDTPPSFAEDAEPILAPYLRGHKPADLGYAFELVVMSWLEDLTRSQGEGAGWLAQSGLLEAVQDGRVDDPIAA